MQIFPGHDATVMVKVMRQRQIKLASSLLGPSPGFSRREAVSAMSNDSKKVGKFCMETGEKDFSLDGRLTVAGKKCHGFLDYLGTLGKRCHKWQCVSHAEPNKT
jgi:hypothetical protein